MLGGGNRDNRNSLGTRQVFKNNPKEAKTIGELLVVLAIRTGNVVSGSTSQGIITAKGAEESIKRATKDDPATQKEFLDELKRLKQD